MQLSETVEWGLHACLALAMMPKGARLPARALAEYHGIKPSYFSKAMQKLVVNRPGFTGERLVLTLGYFFMWVQGFIEHLLCFMRRDISDGAVKALGVVPIDPFQRFPFKLAH